MKPDDDGREEKLTGQIKRLLVAIEASRRAVLPTSNDALLHSIVETAAKIFGAAAASILLVNEAEEVLEFKVSFGSADHDLVGTKFSYDKGIAGYVFMTGQPIATSNVSEDKRFDQDFAQSTGYVPNSILATPLISSDDRIIGVMEVLDKIDEVSFDMQDMELMAMFARQVALAIDQSQQVEAITETLIDGLRRLAEADGDSAELSDELKHSLASSDESFADIMELAELFYTISQLGAAERKACLKILNVFAEYQRSHTRRFR